MLRQLPPRLALVFCAISLAGCNLTSLLFPPPPPTQQPGNFAAFGVNQYANTASLSWSVVRAQQLAGALSQAEWAQAEFQTDAAVTAQSFVNAEPSTDVALFVGHGGPGVFAFSEIYNSAFGSAGQGWGVGNSSGVFDASSLPYSAAGVPINGRLKWIVADSSDTVAAPSFVDPADPDWTADWSRAFGGSLHGIYGSWQGPGTCPYGEMDRTCDLLDGNTADTLFASYALPNPNSSVGPPVNQGATLHDSWIGAMQNAGYDSSWAIWEDTYAVRDIMSGPGNGSTPPSYALVLSGVPQFYYTTNINGEIVTPATVRRDTFTLAPHSLVGQNVNSAGLVQQYASYLPNAAIHDDGTTYTVRQWPVVFKYVHGLSGAAFYLAPAQDRPLTFPAATARSIAEQFVQQSFGMPPDAVLASTLEQWQVTPSSRSALLVGYEFIWTHADGMIGGDAIKVTVDDWQSSSQTCSQWGVSAPPAHKICITWTTTYTDTPDISYGYRLWRSLGSVNASLQPAGGTSISAVTAASALPSRADITAYRAGLWSPSAMQSSSLGARSAWIFTLGGKEQVAVDASTGKILGAVSYW